MAVAPFNPNEALPGDDDIVSQFPSVEREYRDIMEDWMNTEHDASGHHKIMVLTTVQRDAIVDWVAGSMVYNADTNQLEITETVAPYEWQSVNHFKQTWTPVLSFGGATTGITYAVQNGTAERIGNMILVSGHIALTSIGSATGVATISSPETAAASPEAPTAFIWTGPLSPLSGIDEPSANTWVQMGEAGTFFEVYQYEQSVGTTQLSHLDFNNDSAFVFNIWFRV